MTETAARSRCPAGAARGEISTRREAHFGDRIVRCFSNRDCDLAKLLDRAADMKQFRDAIVAGELRLTWHEVREAVEQVAAGLAHIGLRPGDRICVAIGNRSEFVIMVLAALRLRAIAVPVGTRLSASEVDYILRQCGAKILAVESEAAGAAAAAIAIGEPLRVIDCGLPSGRYCFGDLRLDLPPLPRRPQAEEEETAFLLYTSGTTGRPKGAMLTHLNVWHSLRHFELAHRLGDDERSLLAVPATHVTGLIAIILSMVNVAGTIIMLPVFNARRFIELAARERMTHTVLVPAMYNLCLLDPEFDRYDLSNWRLGSYGGAPMPETAILALGEKLPALTLMNGYGATETASPTSLTPHGEGLSRRDTIGKAVHCAEVMIVDEQGRELPAGEIGELWIGGPMVVPGYWNDPEATAASFTAGYWRSGDIGSCDAQGYLRLVDRKKDLINRGGYKIYSVEVENVIARYPGVAEVAVVAKACPVLGERVHAWVSRLGHGPDENQLKAFCATMLADYKVPESFTILDSPLPRNSSGKILKRELRERLKDGAE